MPPASPTATPQIALPQVPQGLVETFYGQGLVRSASAEILDYWRDLDGHLVRIKPISIPTPEGNLEMDMISIRQREGNLRVRGDLISDASSSFVGYVPNLMSYVRPFVEKVYTQIGAEEGIKAIKAQRDFLNGVSSIVIFTDKNDISKIRAVFRVVRRGNLPENKLLDAETDVEMSLPEIQPEIRMIEGRRVAFGDWAELKTLVKDQDLKVGLLPYLFLGLDQNDYFAFTNRTVVINGEIFPLAASHYVLVTDLERTEHYKKKFGFKMDERLSKSPKYVMTQSFEGFKASLNQLREQGDENLKRFVDSRPLIAWNYQSLPHRNSPKSHAEQIPYYLKKYPAAAPQSLKAYSYRQPITVKYKIGWFVTVTEKQYRDVHIPERELVPNSDDKFVPPNAEPYHPFDFFQRLGLPTTASEGEIYDAYRRLSTKHGFGNTIGWDPFAGLKIDEAGLELVGRGSFGRFKFIKEYAQKLRGIYHEFGQRGFADPRFDPDPPLVSRSEHLRRILLNPDRFFNELEAAVQEALQYRHEDGRLDVALASIVKIPYNEVWDHWISQAAHQIDPLFGDLYHSSKRRFNGLVGTIVQSIEASFAENIPTHQWARWRLKEHGRFSQAGFKALVDDSISETFKNLIVESLYAGADYYRREDLMMLGFQKAKDIVFRYALMNSLTQAAALQVLLNQDEDRYTAFALKELIQSLRLESALKKRWPELLESLGVANCSQQIKAIVRYVEQKNKIIRY